MVINYLIKNNKNSLHLWARWLEFFYQTNHINCLDVFIVDKNRQILEPVFDLIKS